MNSHDEKWLAIEKRPGADYGVRQTIVIQTRLIPRDSITRI